MNADTAIIVMLALNAVMLLGITAMLNRIRKLMTPKAEPLEATPTPERQGWRTGPPRKPGDRVRVLPHGWNAGATGTVEYQEPHGRRCWVLRDGSDGAVWYMNHELEDE